MAFFVHVVHREMPQRSALDLHGFVCQCRR